MTSAQVSTWARRYVLASAGFLVLWQVAVLAALPRRTAVTLGLLGFVLHMVFGKAYSLVPSYFDRRLEWGWAPGVQFPLTVLGAVSLAIAPHQGVPTTTVRTAGATLWTVGVAVFLAALLWTIRGNLSGRETATGGVNEDRQPIDRFANAFVPLALGYLALGTYALLAPTIPALPAFVDGYPARTTHLLGAGTASLLVFALGFRLLPRFMVATPPRPLVRLVLPAGAIAPVLLAISLPAGGLFVPAAILQAVAVTGFAVAIVAMVRQTDRHRVGFHGALAGAGFGVVGVLLGLHFAFAGATPGLAEAHYRVNLLGFLGLTIIGVAFQFYPPNAASPDWAGDRTALAAIGLVAAGLVIETFGHATDISVVVAVGTVGVLLGTVTYLALLTALFRSR